MTSNPIIWFASFLALGTLLAQHPLGGPGGPGFGGATVTGAPFSATKTDIHQQTLADGNQIQETRTEKVYRDTDGRTRTESTMKTPDGQTKTMIMIFDPVAGFVAHLNPADSMAMKMTIPTPPTGAPKTHPTPTGVTKTDLGTQTIAGLAATGTSTTRTIPAGTIGNSEALIETREVWVSTTLKIPVKTTSTDPQHGSSSMVMSNITQSAPDSALFQIPATYTVKDAPASQGPHGREPGGPDGPPAPRL